MDLMDIEVFRNRSIAFEEMLHPLLDEMYEAIEEPPEIEDLNRLLVRAQKMLDAYEALLEDFAHTPTWIEGVTKSCNSFIEELKAFKQQLEDIKSKE